MLLSLDETLKEHLNILNSFDETVVAEFCKIAINFLNKGGKVGEKSLQSAASKLGLETKQIKYDKSRNPSCESSTCNHPNLHVDAALQITCVSQPWPFFRSPPLKDDINRNPLIIL